MRRQIITGFIIVIALLPLLILAWSYCPWCRTGAVQAKMGDAAAPAAAAEADQSEEMVGAAAGAAAATDDAAAPE